MCIKYFVQPMAMNEKGLTDLVCDLIYMYTCMVGTHQNFILFPEHLLRTLGCYIQNNSDSRNTKCRQNKPKPKEQIQSV